MRVENSHTDQSKENTRNGRERTTKEIIHMIKEGEEDVVRIE